VTDGGCGSHGTRIVRATAVYAGFRTDSPVNIDLSVPIWTIEHVAAACHLSVDAAREYTYRDDFPAAKTGFARNLWLREDVLGWFAALPAKHDQRTTRRATTHRAARRAEEAVAHTQATGRPAPTPAARPGTATAPAATQPTYRPRKPKRAAR
jgi:hypothetical protein